MSNYATITFEISKDNEIYKKAEQISKENCDLSVFSTPEKVIEYCLCFCPSNVLSYMEYIPAQAKAYREKCNNIK